MLAMMDLLDENQQPKFINELPSPPKINAIKGGKFHVDMRQTNQWLGLYKTPGADGIYGTNDDEKLETTVWGYSLQGKNAITYPGPTFVTQAGVPIEVEWSNHLPKGEHLLPVDETILDPDIQKAIKDGYIPTVSHLHGSNSEAASDGYPEAWYTQNYTERGSAWVKKAYSYDNKQEASTLWYHDHTLGLTRLNVYAGLAGMYLVRDANENNLIRNNVLPSGTYERELLIQDRMFAANGNLYYPSKSDVTNAPNPSILPEFFGNVVMVNGMAWPKLSVEQRKYRLRLANGSDSRTYVLEFDKPGEKFYEIGTEQGFIDRPISLDKIVLAPGQRMDVVVDFSGNRMGDKLILKNMGSDEPFDGLDKNDREVANPATTGQVMEFVVNQGLARKPDATIDTKSLTTRLRTAPIATPMQTAFTEQLVLFESEDKFGRTQPRLGTLHDGSLLWEDPVTEKIPLGTSPVWEFYNTTSDSHPIHLHASPFQILSRQQFVGDVIEAGKDSMGGTKQYLKNVHLKGTSEIPQPFEQGWEDTVIVNPGEVVRVISKPYEKVGRFVWHCHILSHEDNDMMRAFDVIKPTMENNKTTGNDGSSQMSASGMHSNSLANDHLPGSDGRLWTGTNTMNVGLITDNKTKAFSHTTY